MTVHTLNAGPVTVGAAGAPAFQNSWGNLGASYEPAEYWVDAHGELSMHGYITGGGADTVAFTLPLGYRPARPCTFIGVHSAIGFTWISIDTSGNVTITFAATAGVWVSLDQVRFLITPGVSGSSLPSGAGTGPSSGPNPGGPAGGDLSGTYPNPTVASVLGGHTPEILDHKNAASGYAALDANRNILGAGAILTATSAAATVATVLGAPSQTGDLTEWQNSSSGVLAKIDSGGNLTAASVTSNGALSVTGASTLSSTLAVTGAITASGGATVSPAAAAGIAAVFKGLASQSGDLWQAQNSSAAVLAKLTSAGNLIARPDATGGGLFIGDVGWAGVGYLGIALNSNASTTGYALIQGATQTFLNAPTGGTVALRINNTSALAVTSSIVSAFQPLDLSQASASIAASGTNNVGDKIGLYSSAAGGYYGIGVQSGRLVLYATGSVGIRAPAGSGNLSSGTEGINLNPSGAITQALTALTYSASITPNATNGPWQTITVTNATAFTINAPSSPPSSTQTAELTVEVYNNSGGAMGAITWNGAYVFATGAWANPATGKHRFASFRWNGSNWICRNLATSDY